MIPSINPYASPYRVSAVAPASTTIQPTVPSPVPAAPQATPSFPVVDPAPRERSGNQGLTFRAQSFLSNLWDTVIGPMLAGFLGLFTGGG